MWQKNDKYISEKNVSNQPSSEEHSHEKIMAYTGHKSVSSLINYDRMDHKSASDISNILLTADSVYERHPARPILIESPRARSRANRVQGPGPSTSTAAQASTPTQQSVGISSRPVQITTPAMNSPCTDSDECNFVSRRSKRRV